ncbi:hypothetical protein ACOKFD_15780 [Flagellimonas sp. S174]|uniref:hypothetical protein n=1 Tax=Flagellimonas sp. S174 TaxID=3410790 RepID=UPI003BF5AC58
MNRPDYIQPALGILFAFYLRHLGDAYYSMAVFAISMFMWLLVFGNNLRKPKQQ